MSGYRTLGFAFLLEQLQRGRLLSHKARTLVASSVAVQGFSKAAAAAVGGAQEGRRTSHSRCKKSEVLHLEAIALRFLLLLDAKK